MVRGLVIRQLFLFLDVVLIGLIVFAVGMVLMRVINTPKVTMAANVDSAAVAADGQGLIGALENRTAYNAIQQNGLFGNAGRVKMAPEVKPAAAPVPLDEPVEETALNLKLWGTTSLSPTSPFATASIEDASKRERQLYRIGEPIVDNVSLEEIHQRWVIIMNRRETPPKRERLSMDDEEEGGTQLASGGASNYQSARQTVLPSERVELNKQEFVRELYVNYADLVTKVKPELYRDASGNVAGVTAADIEEIPLAKQLGLQDNDVLQTVNNEQIDSEQKVMEMVQKYQNSNSFRIGIMRNGKQKIITYNFR